MTKAQRAERDEAITKLREWIKPGDTVYTILDNVSRSGMSRAIRVVLLDCADGRALDRHPNYAVGRALGLKHWRRNGREQDALVLGGCGMDMGFHLVYELSSVLYGHGYACLGKGRCPSNYHVNHHDTINCPGTRVYNPDGPDTGSGCYEPWRFRDRESGAMPEGWPEDAEGRLLCAIHEGAAEDGSGGRYVVCPTCKGAGRIDNPEGPERFDLVHTDGYALRQRWL